MSTDTHRQRLQQNIRTARGHLDDVLDDLHHGDALAKADAEKELTWAQGRSCSVRTTLVRVFASWRANRSR